MPRRLGFLHNLGDDYHIHPSVVFTNEQIGPHDCVIGDIHGNALALIHYLITLGIIELHSEQVQRTKLFNKLTESYDFLDFQNKEIYSELFASLVQHEPEKCSKHSGKTLCIAPFAEELRTALKNFLAILNKAKIKIFSGKLRLLGDLLSDRGANDYLILKVLEKLKDNHIDYEINISNHDLDFMKYLFCAERGNILRPQSVSLSRMIDLIDRSIITLQQVKELFYKTYRENIVVLSYNKQPDGTLDIYSHAPTSLQQLTYLRPLFDMGKSYTQDDEKKHITKAYDNPVDKVCTEQQALVDVIDRINHKIMENFEGFIVKYFEYEKHILDVIANEYTAPNCIIYNKLAQKLDGNTDEMWFRLSYFVYLSVWQRYKNLARYEQINYLPSAMQQVECFITTGHDKYSYHMLLQRYNSLDTSFGKIPHYHPDFEKHKSKYNQLTPGKVIIGTNRYFKEPSVVEMVTPFYRLCIQPVLEAEPKEHVEYEQELPFASDSDKQIDESLEESGVINGYLKTATSQI